VICCFVAGLQRAREVYTETSSSGCPFTTAALFPWCTVAARTAAIERWAVADSPRWGYVKRRPGRAVTGALHGELDKHRTAVASWRPFWTAQSAPRNTRSGRGLWQPPLLMPRCAVPWRPSVCLLLCFQGWVFATAKTTGKKYFCRDSGENL